MALVGNRAVPQGPRAGSGQADPSRCSVQKTAALTLARHLRDLRLAHRLSACSTRRRGVAVGVAVAACARGSRARCRVGTQPPRHGRTASKTVRGTGRGGRPRRRRGPGAVVRSFWSATTPACRPRGRVRRRPGPGHRRGGLHSSAARSRASALAWASSRAAARWASLAWAVCNAASACPARASAARTLASSMARPAIRSRWAFWTTSWASRPPSARLFIFIALAVVGEG